ncbi:hypothetical protein D1007_55460 [Hordeum vulgare]|nr:hypothetical protein D1007_55460 [Hordeum vulgare]
MAKADKYASADSAMRIKVTALDKVVPAPATPKPAGDNRGGQNNYKRKADQMDPRSNNKLVANVEGGASASQAGPPRKLRNQGNPNWLPKQSLEQLLDPPARYIMSHTLRQLLHESDAVFPHPSTVQHRMPAVTRGGPVGSFGRARGAPYTGSPSRSASAVTASRRRPTH